VAVLNGGWDKWRRESCPVSSQPYAYEPGKFTATPRTGLIASLQEVEKAITESGVGTLCVLSPEVYHGTSEKHSGRPGHIPGSLNDYYRDLVDPDTGTFLDSADLRERFATLGVFEKDRVIIYCGGGIASTLTALALRLAGHQDVAVYDGSLREWAADPNLPLEL
jgi:thiosulfate/3-mercaptopyruvate sulfurtransferase